MPADLLATDLATLASLLEIEGPPEHTLAIARAQVRIIIGRFNNGVYERKGPIRLGTLLGRIGERIED